MGDGRRERHHVEDRPAADDNDERLAVEADVVEPLQHLERVSEVVLDRLASRHDDRRGHELQSVRERGEIAPHRRRERGMGCHDLTVDHREHTMASVRLFPPDDVEKHRVGRVPCVLRKEHREPERNREPVGVLHGRESVQQIVIQYGRGGDTDVSAITSI